MQVPDKDWVRFTGFYYAGPEDITVPGMLGVVLHDSMYAYVCTPGISTMILPLGSNKAYGYFDRSFEYLGRQPTQAEQDHALELQAKAYELNEQERGWLGYLRIKGKLVNCRTVCRELLFQLERLVILAGDPDRHKERLGCCRRLRTLLEAFRSHPDRAMVQELLDLLPTADSAASQWEQLKPIMESWCELVLLDPGPSTQREQIYQSLKDGTARIDTLPYPPE